jgi:signal transduction histidine kinase
MLRADVESLQRAVHNLIVNAIKYAADGGWLKVSISIEQTDRNRTVLISVADRGPGIASSELAQIFEPFYRGQHAVEAQIHGSGLGLSLVKMAAEAHGGQIEVATRPGAGCIFTIRIPANMASESLSEPLEVAHASEAGNQGV